MKFWRKTGDRVLVVGVFQGSEKGRAVLKKLRRARFRRVAAIRVSSTGKRRIEEMGVSALGGAVVAALLGLALGAFISWLRGTGIGHPPWLQLLAFALSGALAGWILIWLLRVRVATASVAPYARVVLGDELMILAEVESGQTARLIGILRDVGADPPVTFAFHTPPVFPFETPTRLIWPERAV